MILKIKGETNGKSKNICNLRIVNIDTLIVLSHLPIVDG